MISPEVIRYLQERSRAFQRGTQRKGRPMKYGTGIPPKPKKAKR